ncbi:uncharacterized protein JCM15063_005336 [Sporobolomyces koalae]|uniref:uncharacterized protein n=1 Tax=Sporobolomyces koalae TaxID=500713 RepID=UPI00317CB8CE
MSGNEVRHLIKTCTYFVLDLRKYNERVFKEDQSKYIKVVFHEAIAVYLWCDYINHYAVLFSPILKRGLWKDIYNHELMTFVNRPHADPVLDLIVLDFHSDGEQARPDGRSEFLQELFGTTDDTGYKRSGFKCRVTFQNAAETPPPASTLTYEHRSGYGGYAIEVADPSFLLAETFLHLASNKASAPKSSYWNELLVLYGLHDAVGKHAAAHKSAPATVKSFAFILCDQLDMPGSDIHDLLEACKSFAKDLRKYNQRVFKEDIDEFRYIKVVLHGPIAVYLWYDCIYKYAYNLNPVRKSRLREDIDKRQFMSFSFRSHPNPRSGFKCRVTFQGPLASPPLASTLTYRPLSGYGGYAVVTADPSVLLSETLLRLASNKKKDAARESAYWNELLVLHGLHLAVNKYAAVNQYASAAVERFSLDSSQVRQEWRTFLDRKDYAEIRDWVWKTRKNDRDKHHAAALDLFIAIVWPERLDFLQTQRPFTFSYHFDAPVFFPEFPANPHEPQKRGGFRKSISWLLGGGSDEAYQRPADVRN